MGSHIIMCELCFALGAKNVIICGKNPLEEAQAHKNAHKRQLRLIGQKRKSFKIKLAEETYDSTVAKRLPSGSRAKPPLSKTDDQKPQEPKKEPPEPKPRQPRPPPPPPPPPPVLTDHVDQVCHDLVKENREGRSIRCGTCQGFVTVVRQRDQIEIQTALQHVYKHLGSFVFSCNQCDYRSETETMIKQHLHSVHTLSGRKENYKVSSGKSEEELIAMLKTCYAKGE